MTFRLKPRHSENELCASSSSMVSITGGTPNYPQITPRSQNYSEESSFGFNPPPKSMNHFQRNESEFPVPFPSSYNDPFLPQWPSQEAPPSPCACDEFQEQYENNGNSRYNSEEDQNDGFFLTLPTQPREYYFMDCPSSQQQLASSTETEGISSPNYKKKNKNSRLSPRKYLTNKNDASSTITITNTTRLTVPNLREHQRR